MSTNFIELQIINDICERNENISPHYFNIKSGCLYLDYPCILNTSDTSENIKEELWTNIILGTLNTYKKYDIITNTKELYFITDYYFSFPKIFLHFPNIIKLEIAGTRWFNIDCNQIPKSVEHLILVSNINLPLFFMRGSQNLVNLKYIDFNINIFFDVRKEILYSTYNEIYEEIEPIPNLENLIKVSLNYFDVDLGCEPESDIDTKNFIDKYKNTIINHKLFENIKNKISDVYIDNYNFIINLSKF